jgi:hypothetical protein
MIVLTLANCCAAPPERIWMSTPVSLPSWSISGPVT